MTSYGICCVDCIEYWILDNGREPTIRRLLNDRRAYVELYRAQLPLDVDIRCDAIGDFTDMREFLRFLHAHEGHTLTIVDEYAPWNR